MLAIHGARVAYDFLRITGMTFEGNSKLINSGISFIQSNL